MELNGILGKLYELSGWIMRFSFITILWLLFNFPIVYIGLRLFIVENFGELQTILIMMAALSPFFFFPATTAMFGVARKWVLNRDDDILIIAFWKYYRENYVKSMLGGLILTPIWAAWIMNYFLSQTQVGSGFFYVFIIGTLFLFSCTVHFFSDTVHFNLGVFASLKKSVFISIGNPHYILIIGLLNGMLIYCIFNLTVIVLFFVGAVSAYISFGAYYKIILKAQSRLQTE